MSDIAYLCFSLGDEEYALPLLSVREVLGVPEITKVPFVPSYVLGLMNLRGHVISVLDLRQKFGIKPHDIGETAVIICDFGELTLGVVVDSVNAVVSPKPEEVSPRPQIHGARGADAIIGIVHRGNRLIILLDVGKALDADDLKAVAQAIKAKQAA